MQCEEGDLRNSGTERASVTTTIGDARGVTSTRFSGLPPKPLAYPPALYTFIHALGLLHSGHLFILAAHVSQHTRWPHSL